MQEIDDGFGVSDRRTKEESRAEGIWTFRLKSVTESI